RRDGRGPEAVRGGPADPGATDLADGAASAGAPAEQGPGGVDRPGGRGAGGRGHPGPGPCPPASRGGTAGRPAGAPPREGERGPEGGEGQPQDRAVGVEPPAGDAGPGTWPHGVREGPGRCGDALDRRVAADGDRGGGPGLEARRARQLVSLAAPP